MTALVHPLVELSRAVDPTTVRHPLARQALVEVVRGLRHDLLDIEAWPKGFQIVGLAFAALAKDRCLIADDQGLGKTCEAVLRILLGRHFPAVVICTASSLHDWHREFTTWAPGLPVTLLDRTSREIPRGFRGVVVTTWTLLSTHLEALRRLHPRIVVGDEAQYVTNDATARAKAFLSVQQGVPHLLLLTGTPVRNLATELWFLLHMLDPAAWHDPSLFDGVTTDLIDNGHDSRLLQKTRCYMLRRHKGQAIPELPDKHVHMQVVRLSPKMRALYDRALKEFDVWLNEELTRKARTEAARLGVHLDGGAMAFDVERRVERAMRNRWLTRLGYLRALVGRLKVPAALTWILERHAQGEPVVVFATFAETLNLLAAGLRIQNVAFDVIDGSTPKARRRDIVKRFQAGGVPVLLASAAAREGVTLTAARHLLQVERWWTAAAEAQGFDRVHRITQSRQVEITQLVAEDTVDDRMDEVVALKRKIIERVVDGVRRSS